MNRQHVPQTPARRRRGGFTLMEILIVLAILGVIAAMVVPGLLGTQQTANIQATQNSIHGLEQAVKLFAVQNKGQYPQGGQEVIELLVTPQTDATGRTIPAQLEKAPLDAWGNMLFYEYPNTKANITADKPAIWSSGPDAKNDDGAGDDINNWSDLGTI